MNTHLYLMCYRSEALVASHLPAEQFGNYMAVGTQKRTSGNVMFLEVDPSLVDDYLKLPKMLERCTPHADGSPRRSKYISVYRVLEHVPLTALGKLYCTTRDGRVLALESASYDELNEQPGPNMYVELCPIYPRVVSSLAPGAFGKFMTNPHNPVHVPRILFADCLVDRDPDGRLAGYLPYRDPAHIEDCLNQLSAGAGKKMSKTVDRNPPLAAFYRTIRRGFFLADQTGVKFYPYPSTDELDEKHHWWWRSASIG